MRLTIWALATLALAWTSLTAQTIPSVAVGALVLGLMTLWAGALEAGYLNRKAQDRDRDTMLAKMRSVKVVTQALDMEKPLTPTSPNLATNQQD